MQLKHGLGRGYDTLIPPTTADNEVAGKSFHMVPIDSIVPNRFQPRTVFDEEKIRELAESIREQGVLQPLIVAPIEGGRYHLIAGERRLRACRLAKIEELPVVIKDVDDEGMLALSLIENIQREDLNPIEESHAYQELLQQFGYTQEDVAKKVSKSRAAIANSLRLLGLPQVIQEDVAMGRYSVGHARALLAASGLHEQLKIRERILREMPTVRDIEKMVKSYANGGNRKRGKKKTTLTPQMNDLVEAMKASLGTKVEIATKGKGGKITIEYYSTQDLDRIYRRIVGS